MCDAMRVLWGDPDAKRIGRNGQRQHGVDIFGKHVNKCERAGAQCKNSETISFDLVEKEVADAENFKPSLQRFYMVISGERDTWLSRQVNTLTTYRENTNKFPVEILFFQDVCDLLCTDDKLVRKHWPVWKEFYASGGSEANSNDCSIPNATLHVSTLNADSSNWGRGEDNILNYEVTRDNQSLLIRPQLGYLSLFENGGPISPLNYITPTYCPFLWDFPTLDFKLVNNGPDTLYFAEVAFDITESVIGPINLLTIQEDTYRYNAGLVILRNEGAFNLKDVDISFHLFPGDRPKDISGNGLHLHSIKLPLLIEQESLDISPFFAKEGFDLEQINAFNSGQMDSDNVLTYQTLTGEQDRISYAEYEERYKKCLGPFTDERGTLVGEISFTPDSVNSVRRTVSFEATCFLTDEKRKGMHRPPTYSYQAAFPSVGSDYSVRVPVSQEIKAGETDRFTIRVALKDSTSHKFRIRVFDVKGRYVESSGIDMTTFIPRSRKSKLVRILEPESDGE